MPHVVVKGKVEGFESTVFGLSRAESEAVGARGGLVRWGGRVGQDGQGFKHPPLCVIAALENMFGYRVLTSTMGTQQSAIWTLHRPLYIIMCEQTGCSHQHTVPSVQQTLDELDFERGIWTAALDGDEAKVRDLLKKGTCVDVRDTAGYTALHYAARSGRVGMCELLLSVGARVNNTTRAGQATPLHRAAMAGHMEIVKLLLHHGADLFLKDVDGKTAADRAKENHHLAILELLSKE